MSALEWLEDSNLYKITESNTGQKYLLNDAYAQWTLGLGRDFEVTESIREPGEPGDYRYFSVVGELDETPKIGLALDEAQATNIKKAPTNNNQLIQRLPIREYAELKDQTVTALAPYDPPHGLSPKQAIVIGVIDDSFNPVHERFLVENKAKSFGTRFDYLWVQDTQSSPSDPAQVTHGREYKRQEINAELNRDPSRDEIEILESLGLVEMGSAEFQPNPLQYKMTHGGFVANLAAGYTTNDKDNLDRRIVAAQLPIMATQDTSGATLISSIISSIQYIFDRAKLMSEATSKALPVIINFSYGLFGGPHNGKHIVEQAFLKNAEAYRNNVKDLTGGEFVPVEIVLPAGNNALAQSHAATKQAKNANEKLKLDLNLRVQPEDQTSSFVEFWLPKGSAKSEFEIKLPDGTSTKFNIDHLDKPFGRVLALKAKNKVDKKTVVARIKLDCPLRDADADETQNYWRVLLAIAPTLLLDTQRRPAPAGIWQIKMMAKVPKGSCLNTWVQRDVAVSGASFQARQAYFEDEVYEENRFDRYSDISVYDRGETQIKRNGTISGIATFSAKPNSKIGLTVVGGYQWSNDAGAFYTAAGADMVPNPGTMVATDTSRALGGILSIGTLSGSTLALNGTSVGSPQVVRLLADAIAKIAPEDRDQYSRKQALADFGTGPIVRPSKSRTELLTNSVIRKERNESTRLSPLKGLKDNIERGRYSSI